MALENSACLVRTDNCELHKYVNNTVYGAPNQDRNQAAEYLLVAYVNQSEVESFITVDSTPYISKLEYDINTTIDGHYRYERMRFQFWNSGANYVKKVTDINNIITTYPSLIYYALTGKFYKAKENHSNIAPDTPVTGIINWEEITDFTTAEIRKNPNIEVFVNDFLYDCRGIKCAKNELLKLPCGCVDDWNKLIPYMKRKTLLASARSRADDGNLNEAESITRDLANLCTKC